MFALSKMFMGKPHVTFEREGALPVGAADLLPAVDVELVLAVKELRPIHVVVEPGESNGPSLVFSRFRDSFVFCSGPRGLGDLPPNKSIFPVLALNDHLKERVLFGDLLLGDSLKFS